jgi:hypothetical protein
MFKTKNQAQKTQRKLATEICGFGLRAQQEGEVGNGACAVSRNV